MLIEVSTDNSVDGSETLTSVIKGLVQQELAHLEEHITRIEVHLSEPSTGATGHEEKTLHVGSTAQGAAAHGRQTCGFNFRAGNKGRSEQDEKLAGAHSWKTV